tara:strand:+ start:17306 stop:18277 length:972 start_codon:yes stop_codon:yes gene_type:complete
MNSKKILALAVTAALLAGCGGGGESEPEQPQIENPPGEGGGGSLLTPEPLELGDYPVELEMGEDSSIQIEIPFSNPTGSVSFGFQHDFSASVQYTIRDTDVLLTIESEELQLNKTSGVMTFTLSDDDEELSGIFGLVVTNTSGDELASEVEFVSGQLDALLTFDEHQKIFSAHLDLARYSGALNDSMVSEVSLNYDNAVKLNAELCTECMPDVLEAPLNSYHSGGLDELELKANLSHLVQNIQTLSDNLMSPINVLLESSGRDAIPHPQYAINDKYGLTSFVGNTQYGSYDESGFAFSSSFSILEDILLVTETACFTQKGDAE